MINRIVLRRNNIPIVVARMMSSSSSTDVVLVNEVKNCGILTLNKPKALNALNIDMVRYECIKKKNVNNNEIIQHRL